MPGSGKSTFAQQVATKLSRKCIDTDEVVITEYLRLKGKKATIREIVSAEGMDFFRHLEAKVVDNLKDTKNAIIATGGGTLSSSQNIHLLQQLGWLIYLKTSTSTLFERLLKKEHLPTYIDKADIKNSFDVLIQQRLPIFEQSCDVVIDLDFENTIEIITGYASKVKSHGK